MMPRWYQSRIVVWTVASFLLYTWYSYTYNESLVQRKNEQRSLRVDSKQVRHTAKATATTAGETTKTTTEITVTTPESTRKTTTRAIARTAATPSPMEQYHFSDARVYGKGSVNPHPFIFTMNPTSLCRNRDVFLLFYVVSHPDNFERRQIVRETWGNVSRYRKMAVLRIFVMGETLNAVYKNLLNMESLHYGDIVQENFLDTYRNLTYKTVGALKWVSTYCSHARLVLKTDDDAFVNMFVLLRHLKSRLEHGQYGQRTLACNVWYKAKVHRTGKWGVTRAERKYPIWPTFCQGLAYIMSPDVVSALYRMSFDVPYLWLEDVYVTGFLAMKLGIEHQQINRTFVKENDFIRLISGSQWYRCLFSHVKDLNVTVLMWNALLRKPGLPLYD